MRTLTWRSILSSGKITVGDTRRNHIQDFTLSRAPVNSAAALLIMDARNVDHEKSFVTINQANPAALDDISHDEAKSHDWFVSRIPSTGSKYTMLIHRIKPGVLRDGANHFGVHARSSTGISKATTAVNLDDFHVARVFVVYTTEEN